MIIVENILQAIGEPLSSRLNKKMAVEIFVCVQFVLCVSHKSFMQVVEFYL